MKQQGSVLNEVYHRDKVYRRLNEKTNQNDIFMWRQFIQKECRNLRDTDCIKLKGIFCALGCNISPSFPRKTNKQNPVLRHCTNTIFDLTRVP